MLIKESKHANPACPMLKNKHTCMSGLLTHTRNQVCFFSRVQNKIGMPNIWQGKENFKCINNKLCPE
uniref:Uncharacterized protein n=1 Tax=Arundo donax TaxID=35708 RepID=A0A0A8YR04_ARUDO